MGQVTFKTTISGGAGNLKITFDRVADVLYFDENHQGPLSVMLPYGVNNYTVEGNAPPAGNIHLDVTGDIAAPESRDFGPGLILPQSFPIFVTI